MESIDITTLRRANLQVYLEQERISRTELSSRTGLDKSYISRLFNKEDAFGFRAARNIEKKLSLPVNYLDTDHDPSDVVFAWQDLDQIPRNGITLIPIKRYGSMVPSTDLIKNKQHIPFQLSVLQSISVKSLDGLYFYEIGDRTMEPLYPVNGLVLIDVEQLNLVDMGVYLIERNQLLFLRRIMIYTDGTIALIADSRPTVPEIIPAASANDLTVIGRAIWKCDPILDIKV